MSLSYKNKSIIMGVVCTVLVVAIGITIFFLIDSLDGNHALENKKEVEKKMYATVLEVGKNYIKIDPIDDEEVVHVNTSEKLSKGDFIVITYNEDEALSITPNTVEVIASNNEITVVPNTTAIANSTTTNKKITTQNTKASKSTTRSTETPKKTTTTTKNIELSEEEIINYAKLSYDEANDSSEKKSISASIKSKFVTLVDFIFYDGKIKGKTFKELSDKAKAKVIYYTLLMDSKIDSKWPDYKQTIKNKTNDLKAKLIAKYMDITSNICENHADGCEMVKNDFALLKKSLNLTWDIVKSAFSYGYNKTYTYLKNWYEVWRDK